MTTRALVLLCFLALAAACGEQAADPEGDEATAETATEATPDPPAEPEEQMSEAPTSRGGSCGRVEACCRGFHEAKSLPPSPTCDGFRLAGRVPDSDECEPTLAGYRRTLEADGLEVPPSCL